MTRPPMNVADVEVGSGHGTPMLCIAERDHLAPWQFNLGTAPRNPTLGTCPKDMSMAVPEGAGAMPGAEVAKQNLFRDDVDVTALYIAMSGLGYFYCANRWTLSAAFVGKLFDADRLGTYEEMLGEMVVAYPRKPR